MTTAILCTILILLSLAYYGSTLQDDRERTFNKDDKIIIFGRTGARDCRTNDYVSIEGDMVLIFVRETPDCLIFTVRCNFMPVNKYEAKDGNEVYFTKRNFSTLKYRKQ